MLTDWQHRSNYDIVHISINREKKRMKKSIGICEHCKAEDVELERWHFKKESASICKYCLYDWRYHMFRGDADDKPCPVNESEAVERKRKTHILTVLLEDTIEENGTIFLERFAEDKTNGTNFDLTVIELFRSLQEVAKIYLAKLPQ